MTLGFANIKHPMMHLTTQALETCPIRDWELIMKRSAYRCNGNGTTRLPTSEVPMKVEMDCSVHAELDNCQELAGEDSEDMDSNTSLNSNSSEASGGLTEGANDLALEEETPSPRNIVDKSARGASGSFQIERL